MLCTNCHDYFTDGMIRCPSCGHPVATCWEVLTTVYPPEDDIIKSLLESCEIPVILRSREGIGRVQGLSFGPLAEIMVMVPKDRLAEARDLLVSRAESQKTEEI
ncbi:MAG: putative signal transducing protein [Bacillota bacterium]